MKQWTVYFRDKNGSKASVVIEAEDRAGVFAELKKRGISAISVTEGASNKKPRKAASGGAPSKGRGLLAAAIVVLGAGLAVWWFFISNTGGNTRTDTDVKKSSKIAEVKPSLATANKIDASAVDTMEAQREKWKRMGYPKNPWGQQKIPEDLEYKPHWKYTTEDYARIDPGYKARHEAFLSEQAKIPWQHACEIEIAQTLFAKPEDAVLFTPLQKNFTKQFLKSLENPIVVSEEDSEEVAQQKREMIKVKIYLKERLDAGEDIVDIINEARSSLAELNGLRQNLLTELRNLEKTAKSEQEIDDYVEAANMMLRDKGAGTIRLPISATRLRLRAEARTQKK